MQQRNDGFSLIELMVVLAIMGIIFSVAIPAYQSNIQRGNRGDAIDELHSILAAQERFYADNSRYTTNLSDLGYTNNSVALDKYTISAAACSGMAITQCVALTASAKGGQAADGDLLIDSLGNQSRVIRGATPAEDKVMKW
jgi:type IV pilus assembly protein PilE